MILTWRQVKGESLHLAKGLLELANRSIKISCPLSIIKSDHRVAQYHSNHE